MGKEIGEGDMEGDRGESTRETNMEEDERDGDSQTSK